MQNNDALQSMNHGADATLIEDLSNRQTKLFICLYEMTDRLILMYAGMKTKHCWTK